MKGGCGEHRLSQNHGGRLERYCCYPLTIEGSTQAQGGEGTCLRSPSGEGAEPASELWLVWFEKPKSYPQPDLGCSKGRETFLSGRIREDFSEEVAMEPAQRWVGLRYEVVGRLFQVQGTSGPKTR